MNNLINQPDFITRLDDLNFPLEALGRCTSNPLVRCYSNLSCTSQDGGATFVPFGRCYDDDNNDYIDLSLLQLQTANVNDDKAKKNGEDPIKQATLSSMTMADLIRMNLSLSELLNYNLICRFLKHQNGSRYVQDKLCENAPSKIIDNVLKHIIFKKRQIVSLSLDVYGNYVIQIMFQICNRKQRKLLMDNLLRGNVCRLTQSFYGCRVIQKACDFISSQQCSELVKELDNKLIAQCVIGQNSNHVLQKILSLHLPKKDVEFIINCILSDIYFYSTHMFGCRVVQTVISNYGESIIEEIATDESLILAISVSEYGNYVVQDILGLKEFDDKCGIRWNVCKNVVSLSKNKFGSNVVEKCLQSSKDKERDLLLEQIIKNKTILVEMIQHKYANYVIQSLLIHSNHKQKSKLIYLLSAIPNLRSFTYGKHIADRIRKIKAQYKNY